MWRNECIFNIFFLTWRNRFFTNIYWITFSSFMIMSRPIFTLIPCLKLFFSYHQTICIFRRIIFLCDYPSFWCWFVSQTSIVVLWIFTILIVRWVCFCFVSSMIRRHLCLLISTVSCGSITNILKWYVSLGNVLNNPNKIFTKCIFTPIYAAFYKIVFKGERSVPSWRCSNRRSILFLRFPLDCCSCCNNAYVILR